MSDLISRSAFIKALNDYVRQAFDCDGIDEGSVIEYQELHKDVTSYIIQGICEAYGILQEQPTAYNVDSVVEEIKKQAEQYRRRGFEAEEKGYSAMADKYYGKYCSYEHAIEIVKGGGNNDNR